MNPRDKPELRDDDPTGKEDALDVDPTRTYLSDDKYRVSLDYTGEFSTGVVDHDDRGHARWKWNTESTPAGEAERTFDLLKALNNDALSITDEQTENPPRKSGYDPYHVGGEKKPKPRKD